MREEEEEDEDEGFLDSQSLRSDRDCVCVCVRVCVCERGGMWRRESRLGMRFPDDDMIALVPLKLSEGELSHHN